MESKETLLKTNPTSGILEDIEYYKYIFKKTEKMACAVFYILRGGHAEAQKDSVAVNLEEAAQTLLDVALETLKSTGKDLEKRAWNLKYGLIRFESKLRVANAARFIDTELLEVFVHEIESVQRSLRKYVEPAVVNPLVGGDVMRETIRGRRPARVKAELTSGEHSTVSSNNVGPVLQSRRDRVLNVLRDKGEATIKDIVEVVTDCSEKTIQRELISLIKDNIVSKEGERRWSKYKLV